MLIWGSGGVCTGRRDDPCRRAGAGPGPANRPASRPEDDDDDDDDAAKARPVPPHVTVGPISSPLTIAYHSHSPLPSLHMRSAGMSSHFETPAKGSSRAPRPRRRHDLELSSRRSAEDCTPLGGGGGTDVPVVWRSGGRQAVPAGGGGGGGEVGSAAAATPPHIMDCPRTRWPQSPRIVPQGGEEEVVVLQFVLDGDVELFSFSVA